MNPDEGLKVNLHQLLRASLVGGLTPAPLK